MSFNPTDFLNATLSSPMSTAIIPVPEGEFTAMVDDSEKFVEFRTAQTKNGDRPICTVWFKVLDDKARALAKRDNLKVKMDIWIDTTIAGTIDTSEGKNTKLGQLRDALGQNTRDEWGFGKLRGAGPVMIKVVHRPNERDPANPFSEVDRVLKIS